MTIREYENKDREQVEGIFELHWNDEGFRERLMQKLDWFIEQGEEYRTKSYRFYVAEDGGEVARWWVLRVCAKRQST